MWWCWAARIGLLITASTASRPARPTSWLKAGLQDVDPRALGHVGVLHLVHGLMAVRVEALAERVDAAHAMPLEHVQQFALGKLDPFEKALQGRVLRRGLGRHVI